MTSSDTFVRESANGYGRLMTFSDTLADKPANRFVEDAIAESMAKRSSIGSLDCSIIRKRALFGG